MLAHRLTRRALASALAAAPVLAIPWPRPAPAFAQPEGPLLRTSGLLDADGTALYSILFFAGSVDLEDVTITAMAPRGYVFEEVVLTPGGTAVPVPADLETDLDLQRPVEPKVLIVPGAGGSGEVVWHADWVPADHVLGPFTIRLVPPAGQPAPAVLPAWAAWDGGSTEEPVGEEGGVIVPVPGEASITLGPAGTGGAVELANGVTVAAPPGTVAIPTDLTIERLPIDEAAGLPADPSTWWCALVRCGLAGGELAAPLDLALPVRRVLTPGLPCRIFGAEGPDGAFEEVRPRIDARILASGERVALRIAPRDGERIAAGVDVTLRAIGLRPVATIPPDPFA